MAEHRAVRALVVVLNTFVLVAAVGLVRPEVASAVDFTPPTCSVGVNGSTIQLTLQDSGSGLDSISTQESVNAMVTIPSFSSGTTTAQVVTASAAGAGQATVRVKGTDVDGNSVDCGRITFKNESLAKGGKLSDSLTGIQQSQSFLEFYNGTPGFSRLRVIIGRSRPRITLTDGQLANLNLSGLVAGSNTVGLDLNGHAGDTGFVLVKSTLATTIACPEDATRTIFAGGRVFTGIGGACRQFSGDQASCNLAYHINSFNEPASCFWDAANSECIGCGPFGGQGNSIGCTNTCLPEPADPCTSPGTIPAGGGIVTGTTTGHAGADNGTCATPTGPEAAFAWTPNFTGGARISTCGETDFPSVVYVREATCSTGDELACNQGYCSGQGSAVGVSVTSGTTYYIFVDGDRGASGNFQLSVSGPYTCPADATRTIYAGGPGRISAACRQFENDQTSCEAAFHTTFIGEPASCFYDTSTDECVGCSGNSTEFNDVNCTNTCAVSAPTCSGDASRTTFAGQYFSGACRDIGSDQTTCEDAWHLTIGGQPATCFFDTGVSSCFGCGPNNEIAFAECTDTCLTATDPCTSPTVIPAAGGTFNGTTSGKGDAEGVPAGCGVPDTRWFSGPEKVFQWTPSASGTATIKTCGGATSFDTSLYVREATCSSGTQIACAANNSCRAGNGFGAARVETEVTSGTTYYIFVDGLFGEAGEFTLTVEPPTP